MASMMGAGAPRDDGGEWNGAERYAAMQINAAKKMRLAGLLDERAFHALCDEDGLIARGEAEVRYMPQLDSATIRYQGAWRTPTAFCQMIASVTPGKQGGNDDAQGA